MLITTRMQVQHFSNLRPCVDITVVVIRAEIGWLPLEHLRGPPAPSVALVFHVNLWYLSVSYNHDRSRVEGRTPW